MSVAGCDNRLSYLICLGLGSEYANMEAAERERTHGKRVLLMRKRPFEWLRGAFSIRCLVLLATHFLRAIVGLVYSAVDYLRLISVHWLSLADAIVASQARARFTLTFAMTSIERPFAESIADQMASLHLTTQSTGSSSQYEHEYKSAGLHAYSCFLAQQFNGRWRN